MKPDRPDLTGEQWTRWDQICRRLAALADSRGGRAVRHVDDLLSLHAPAQGVCLRIWCVGLGVAQVDVECLRVSATWAMTDGEWEDLEQTARSIMDGRAEVTITYSFNIQHASGDGTSGGRTEPVSYRIPGWTYAWPG